MLAAAVVVALAAERVSADPRGPVRPARAEDLGDIGSFVAPLGLDSAMSRFEPRVWVEPLERRQTWDGVASAPGRPTVSKSVGRGRRLTAILIADHRPVAVIDDEVFGVGGTLKDGARISAIQADRVWLVEKDGKWRMLTLASGRP